MKWAGHVARMKDMRNAHKYFIGKAEGKEPRGSTSRRWENVIR